MIPALQLPAIQPNVLDRVIGFVSPSLGLRRLHSRARLAVASALATGYTGGRTDRRSLREWNPSAGSANADTLPTLPTLRARSRDLSMNAPLAGGAVNTVVTNTVGTGLTLQPAVDFEYLGLTEAEADEWQKQAWRIFAAWAGSPNCDITRQQSFAGLQDLAFRSALESGDVLFVRRYAERAGDVLGLKLQLIEGDRISNPDFRFDTPQLAGGVEVDGNGAAVRYYVRNVHPGELFLGFGDAITWSAVPARGKASNDRIAVLLYHRRRPGQLRGVPYLAPVIEPLKQLDRYSEAEIMAAVISAMFTVFVKAEAGEAGMAGLAPIDGEDPNPPPTTDYKLGHGAILDLAPGESIEQANPTRPNAGYDAFWTSVVRQIGVGLELPYEVLIKHFTASYSASRAAMIEAWKFFRTRREWLASEFCQVAYGWVMSEAIARGYLSAPGFDQDPIARQAWLGARWTGPSQGQIDPLKEVAAADQRIQIGVSTLDQETAALGGDWEDNHRQRAKERRMRYDAGLESSVVDQGIALPRPPQDGGLDPAADPDAADQAELAGVAR